MNIIWWWAPLSGPHGVTDNRGHVDGLLYDTARCTFRLPVPETVTSHLIHRRRLVHATTNLRVVAHWHLPGFTSNLHSAAVPALGLGPRARLLHRGLQRQLSRYPPSLGVLRADAGVVLTVARRISVAGRATVTLPPPSSPSPFDLRLLPLGVLVIRVRVQYMLLGRGPVVLPVGALLELVVIATAVTTVARIRVAVRVAPLRLLILHGPRGGSLGTTFLQSDLRFRLRLLRPTYSLNDST